MVQVSCIYAIDIQIPAGHECDAHQHTCTEIVWCDGCSGQLFQNGQRSTYAEQSLFVYQPGKDHWIKNQTPGRQICIGVQGCHAETLTEGSYPRSDALDQLFAMVAAALKPHQQDQLDCLAGLITLQLTPKQYTTEHDDPASKIKQFIDGHLTDSLSVERIADSIYLSPNYVRQLFKESYGSSIMHYVIQQRLSLAEQLLRDSKLSIQDIAIHCGFQSPYYFSRIFKKYRNCSPSTFRKQS